MWSNLGLFIILKRLTLVIDESEGDGWWWAATGSRALCALCNVDILNKTRTEVRIVPGKWVSNGATHPHTYISYADRARSSLHTSPAINQNLCGGGQKVMRQKCTKIGTKRIHNNNHPRGISISSCARIWARMTTQLPIVSFHLWEVLTRSEKKIFRFFFLFLSLSAHFWHEAINKYDWCVRLMHGREKCGESLKCIEQTAGRWKKLLIQNSVFDKEYLLLERFFYLFISWINNRFEWNVIDQRTLLRLLIYIVVFGSFRLIRNQWYGGNDGPNTVTSHSQ